MNQKRSFRILSGLGAQVRSRAVILRRLAPIIELETMLEHPGSAWSTAFEAKVKSVSLSLFGITDADTRPAEPHPDQVESKGANRHRMGSEAFARYNVMLDAWHDWQTIMDAYEVDLEELGAIRLFGRLGYDVTADTGGELRCLEFIHRPLYIAIKELLPGARVSIDGTGKRAPQSVEEWGAALADEAARFRPTR